MIKIRDINKVLNDLQLPENFDHDVKTTIIDIFSYFKHQFQRAGCKIDFNLDQLNSYAELSLFYPNFSSLSENERINIGLNYSKKLSKFIKNSKISHYGNSPYFTIDVSSSLILTSEIYFNENNSVLEIILDFTGQKRPDTIEGGVYFSPGFSSERIFASNVKHITPDAYEEIVQEIKKLIHLVAQAIRLTSLE